MFTSKAHCYLCKREIQPYEEIYVNMRYPKSKGFTEIKAFLKNEGKIICKDCFPNKSLNAGNQSQ